MAETTISIIMKRNVKLPDGALWPAGHTIHTTAKELSDRKVPKDAYTTINTSSEKPAA